MIEYLLGKMIEKHPAHLIVECAGIGYFVHISVQTYEQLPSDENLRIWIHQVIKEDAHALYGFATRQERNCFRLLIGVNGIGPSIALNILSCMTIAQLQSAVLSEDEQAIKAIKGIGIKTAKQLILDLKDKIAQQTDDLPVAVFGGAQSVKQEAIKALEILGYASKHVTKTVDQVFDPNHSVEEVIRLVLKRI